MNLADKIITLRKKQGWSQEELADRLDVSRQSVSKWEGGQSVPDLNKIILLSQLFGVSTDWLLKDESAPEVTPVDEPKKRLVTKDEAKKFLALRRSAAKRIAIATCMCILSPIVMFLLLGCAATGLLPLSEDLAGILGSAFVVLVAAAACFLFITTGMQVKPFEFIEKEEFDTEFGVADLVRREQNEFLPTYSKLNAIATVLCILAALPVLLGAVTGNGMIVMICLCLTLALAAVGVWFFIYVGVIWASTQKLLQEGEFTPLNKKINESMEIVSGVFWLVATAGYLAWSFTSNAWHISWIVWPVCGVLYAALSIAMRQILKNRLSK